MMRRNIPKENRRVYKRLDTIFPVEFQIVDDNHAPVSIWYQAFSQDISKGGICLTVNQISKGEFDFFNWSATQLLLQIHSPFSDKSFLAYGKIVWIKKIKDLPLPQYILGLHFTRIDHAQINQFLSYIRNRKIIWNSLKALIVCMVFYLGFVLVANYRLQSRNVALLQEYGDLLKSNLVLTNRYHSLLEDREQLTKVINDADVELKILKVTLAKEEAERNRHVSLLEKRLVESRNEAVSSEIDVARIEEQKSELEAVKKEKDQEIARLKAAIVNLKENTVILTSNLDEVIARESEIKTSFSMNKESEGMLVGTLKDKLYQWVKNHQNQRTGLIESVEGDARLRTVSYVYDDGLAIIAYSLFGDFTQARLGLEFFLKHAERFEQRAFYNAYYSKKGDVAEYVAHAGPNLWIGIASAHYAQASKDRRYLVLARDIAAWIETLQDAEGGIRGGRDISWYSTEHNLDGYAFFSMLYELTGDQHYQDNAQKILSWLEKYAYSNDTIPINRGKGDSTIATDTYAWSIAALGPALLERVGMNPDEIAQFAIEHCAVRTEFTDRFGNQMQVEGFDFAKLSHQARGGVVSCEWSAQMVLSFDILADYYAQKEDQKRASYYQAQRIKYLHELNKMIIASPSAFGQGMWCLPYASHQNAATGHGWRTPDGNKTGSVAATAYTLFALSKENPLILRRRQ